MTDLFLHIGHGKTGSTYLQNTWVKSADDLAGIGAVYPVADQLRRRIANNDAKINSGNGWEFLEVPPENLAERYRAAQKLILSSEVFYELILQGRISAAYLIRLTEVFGRVRVLLFVRDPVEVAVSSHQQAVKRHGATDAFTPEKLNDGYVRLLLDALQRLKGIPGLELTVHNYSRERTRIVDLAEAWLGLDRGFLTRPATANVNRSLTPGEIRVQIFLNRLLGPSGPWFADRMCMWFPDRIVPPYMFPPGAIDAYRTRAAAAMAEVNALLPEEARLRIG